MISMMVSMIFRYIPDTLQHGREIDMSQRALLGSDDRHRKTKVARAIRLVSILMAWSMENAIETADSMKSRGYGLPGRTSFSIFRFDRRDQTVFGAMLLLVVIILAGAAAGYNTMRFFPSLKLPPPDAFSFGVYCAYLALCLMPVIIDLAEELKWKHIRSGL